MYQIKQQDWDSLISQKKITDFESSNNQNKMENFLEMEKNKIKKFWVHNKI